MLAFLSKLYGKGEVTQASGELGFRVDAAIPSIAKDEISNTLANLPQELGQQDVETECGKAAESETLSELLEMVQHARERQINATVKMHATAAKHQQFVQKTARQVADIDKNFAEQLMMHGVLMGGKKAEVQAMGETLRNRARTIIR